MTAHTKAHGKHGDFAIEAKGLVKRFKSGKSFIEVLKGVDFDARHGDLTMVMGPSGSGKSTLIAALSGLLRPEEGRVDTLDVDDLWKLSSGRIDKFRLDHCGYIFQGFNLFPALTALQQVEIRTAQREHDRLARLVASNFVAGSRMDQARDAIATAQARLGSQQASVQTARARRDQAAYNVELTVIRAPQDGRIVRRYANPGAGASTLNVSNMFDLEPDAPRIARAEIVESDIPNVSVGQAVEITPEGDPTKVYVGAVLRRAAVFGARKLASDDPSQRSDERVVEVVVSAGDAPLLIGQRVLVKFMKPGETAGAPRPASTGVPAGRAMQAPAQAG